MTDGKGIWVIEITRVASQDRSAPELSLRLPHYVPFVEPNGHLEGIFGIEFEGIEANVSGVIGKGKKQSQNV